MFSFCHRGGNKKKSKSLSEVKSFSSFSFSDVALDYRLYKSSTGGGKHGKSHHLSQSDPSTLDRLEKRSQVANIFFTLAIDITLDGSQ